MESVLKKPVTEQPFLPEDIIADFQQKKIELFKNNPDVVESQFGTERESSKDYAGRIIFELFQNAIDRAENIIIIKLTNNELIVANDGDPFSIYSGLNKGKKSDFHGLCTIHNSPKKAGESIGNKGVGFKSVWNITNEVTIESVTPQGERWGFQLFNPVESRYFERNDIRDIIDRSDGKIPSFYFPRFQSYDKGLLSVCLSDGQDISVITRITVKLNSSVNLQELKQQIEYLRKTELFFVSLLDKKPAPDFTVFTDYTGKVVARSPGKDWNFVTLRSAHNRYTDLIDELDMITQTFRESYNNLPEKPNVSIAFPPSGLGDFEQVIYTYLPTTVTFGFNVLVHADFVLDNSRKVIPTNAYNNQLLKIAIALFTDTLLENQQLHDYPDFFRFLMSRNANIELGGRKVSQIIWETLVKNDSLKTLLKQVYKAHRIWAPDYYQGVFEVITSRTGRDYYEPYDSYYKRIKVIQRIFCDPDIRIVPVSGDQPTYLPSGERNDPNSLFYRSKNFTGKALPEHLLTEIPGLKISSFEFINTNELKKNNIIQEFSSAGLLDALFKAQNGIQSDNIRADIFAFAFAIAQDKKSSVPGYFFDTNISREERMLAGINVPVKTGLWQKAIKTYTDPGFDNWIDKQYFQLVDTEQCLDILSQRGISVDIENLHRTLRNFGVWTNIFPLKWIFSGGQYIFQLPWKVTPQFTGMKTLISNSVSFIDQLPIKKEIYSMLNKENWFYADNLKKYLEPDRVFLFNSNDTRKLTCIPKESRNIQLDELYRVFQIAMIEDTRDADKLYRQLINMKITGDPQNEIGHADVYKSLVLSLSRSDFSQISNDIPVLFRDRKGFTYRQSEDVWFAPREYKKHKLVDPSMKFAFFDDEITRGLLKHARVKVFSPDFRIIYSDNSKVADGEIKQFLQEEYLPALMALAEGESGSRFIREEIYDRWEQLIIYRGGHIQMAVRIMNIENVLESTAEPKVNVLYKPLSVSERETKSRVGELAHDLPDNNAYANTIPFTKFAPALADGIFRNSGLTEIFNAYFDRCLLNFSQPELRISESYLMEKGITSEDILYEKSLMSARLLTDIEWGDFIHTMKTFTHRDDLSKENWIRTEEYNNKELRFSEVEKAFVSHPRYNGVIAQINPRHSNKINLEKEQKRIQALYYLTKERKEKLSSERFFDILNLNYNELDYFRFSLALYYPLFEVLDFPEKEIRRADLHLTHGLIDIRPVSSGIKLVNSNISTLTGTQPIIGTVDPDKEEDAIKKQRQRGLGLELDLILSYLQIRDVRYTSKVLAAIRSAVRPTIEYINKGKTEEYLKFLDMLLEKNGCTDQELEYVLHVSRNIGDGLGYDILIPETEDGEIRILKIEVKSASGGSNRIYLSENERRRILDMMNDDDWRIWINDSCDVALTHQVKSYVNKHNQQLISLKEKNELYMIADKWILEFRY